MSTHTTSTTFSPPGTLTSGHFPPSPPAHPHALPAESSPHTESSPARKKHNHQLLQGLPLSMKSLVHVPHLKADIPTSPSLTLTHPHTPSHPHSVRLQHVPVDQLLFLKTRVRTRQKGAAVLVSSEGGLARFWDIFRPREPVGKEESQIHNSTVVINIS